MNIVKKPIPWYNYKFHKLDSVKVEEREEEYGPTNFKQKSRVMIVVKRWRCANVQELVETLEKCKDTENDDCELLLGEDAVEYYDEEETSNELPIESYEEKGKTLREHFIKFLKWKT